MTTRRGFIGTSAAWLLAAAMPARLRQSDGRLRSRPARHTQSIQPGTHRLGIGGDRDGSLLVPVSYRAARPAPFVLALHGAGGAGEYILESWRASAEAHGLVVLAPDSRGPTWDVVRRGFGPDVEFIDYALAQVFARCAIDASRMVITGFSDGASYALSLGLVNGDLFQRVVAFSPGFMVASGTRGKPAIFVSHGRSDRILPIDATGRRLVATLQRGGYAVTFREFDGGHGVPPGIREEARVWMLAR